MKRIWFAALLLLAILPARDAGAHAVIVSSVPAVNGIVPAGEFTATLKFNSRIDTRLSKITLIDPAGRKQDLTPAAAAGALDTLSAGGNAPGAGAYRLRWQVLSVDGHITRGDIPFTVTENAPR